MVGNKIAINRIKNIYCVSMKYKILQVLLFAYTRMTKQNLMFHRYSETFTYIKNFI